MMTSVPFHLEYDGPKCSGSECCAQSGILVTPGFFKETIQMTERLTELMAGMAVFSRVVESGTFSGAARSLGFTKSAVSKHIARLEALVGVQLLRRTTRSLSLTEAGRAYYDRASHAVALCRDAHVAVSEHAGAPAGLLRVTAPVTFGRSRLMPQLPEFLRRYPDIRLQVVLLDRPVDLAEEGFDLGVRLTRRLSGDLIARELGSFGYVLCASPSYFKEVAHPETPADLARLNCLRYGEGETRSVWRFDRRRASQRVRVRGSLMVNNSEALRAAVLEGVGLALLPDFLVAEDLRAGRLESVLPRWTPQAPFGTKVFAVWLRDRHPPPTLRAFIDYLTRSRKWDARGFTRPSIDTTGDAYRS
jgi:DNA-binding transcriptional LysR family regulator